MDGYYYHDYDCKNCNNCYNCLDDTSLSLQYSKTMKKSILERLNGKCNCYMCNDPRSATCIEIFFYRNGLDYPEIDTKSKEILDNYKKKKRLFLTYMLCRSLFVKKYRETLENMYKPPDGSGYLEALSDFKLMSTTLK
jgi:hypothetical protein